MEISDLAFRREAFRRVRNIHFVGIGGVGMGGIAEVLITQGYHISGSDLKENAVTKRLRQLGAEVKIGHDEQHLHHAHVVVVSSAVDAENPEIVAARRLQIPIISRAEMLAELMRFQQGIAIAGTHGKTTTTSLITSILAEAKLDPTFVIGGLLNSAGSHAKLGQGRYFVAEADESDASFLYLKPMITVVTNIDADHMSTYGGDFERLKQTFIDFIHNLPFYGLVVLCLDDPVIRDILPKIGRPMITYGFHEAADLCAVDFSQQGLQTQFTVNFKDDSRSLPITLNLPGPHNVLNALATIAVAREVGVDLMDIKNALQRFAGVGRRFQICGEFAVGNGKVTLIDDYGHHPTEVRATLKAARLAWPQQRLVMAYQPHRYSRTQELFNEFVEVLAEVDELILLDIYPAGEKPIPGIDGQSLLQAIESRSKKRVHFLQRNHTIEPILAAVLQANDILLMQGAGDIGAMVTALTENSLLF